VIDVNFHIYVFSNARAGLYRTLLSIWKLDPRPSRITILTGQGMTPEIKKSIFTVSEDTSDLGPDFEVHEASTNHREEILGCSRTSNFQFSGFITERDMFLPNFSELISGDVELDSSNVFAYHQRMKFGNSKIILPKNRLSTPLSATILSRDFILTSFMDTNLLVNLELLAHQPQNTIEGSPRVIIQSNIRSAFDL
jgi:hypothetical protein